MPCCPSSRVRGPWVVAAFSVGDVALFGRASAGGVTGPARGALIPGFVEAKGAAIDAVALGASISGAGPTAFAIVDSGETAGRVATAMCDAYARHGVACNTIVTTIDEQGTIVRSLSERGDGHLETTGS